MEETNKNCTKDPDAIKNLLTCSLSVSIVSIVIYSIFNNLSAVTQFLIMSGNKIGSVFISAYEYYQMIHYHLLCVSATICFILLCTLFKTEPKYVKTIKKLEISFFLFASLGILSIISITLTLIIKFTENVTENIFAALIIFVMVLLAFSQIYLDNASHYWKKKDLTQK